MLTLKTPQGVFVIIRHMQHDNPWQHLETKIVYKDEWIVVKNDKVVRPDAEPGSYTYIDGKDSVMILALNENAEIYLEWTYRYPVKTWGWELPGGGMDEISPLEVAKRELNEEAGLTSRDWSELGKTSIYNGLVTGTMHYFKAEGLLANTHPAADDSEITNTGRFFSIASINQMIVSSEISDSHTIAGIHLFQLGDSSNHDWAQINEPH